MPVTPSKLRLINRSTPSLRVQRTALKVALHLLPFRHDRRGRMAEPSRCLQLTSPESHPFVPPSRLTPLLIALLYSFTFSQLLAPTRHHHSSFIRLAITLSIKSLQPMCKVRTHTLILLPPMTGLHTQLQSIELHLVSQPSNSCHVQACNHCQSAATHHIARLSKIGRAHV